MNDDGISESLIKRAAESEYQAVLELRSLVINETVGSGKFLLGSLLGINGGAAAATLGADIPSVDKVVPCGIFSCGILLVLLIAHMGMSQGAPMAKKLTESLGYWLTVMDDGIRVEEIEDANRDSITKFTRRNGWIKFLGYTSLACFVFGGVLLAQRILTETPINRTPSPATHAAPASLPPHPAPRTAP